MPQIPPFNPLELAAVMPEAVMLVVAILILAVDLLTRNMLNRRLLGMLTAGGMVIALITAFITMPSAGADPFVLGGMLRHDTYTFAFKLVFIVAAALTALAAGDFRAARAGGEFYALLVLSAMAMCLMAGASDIIMLYMATETASIALYLLAGFMRDTPRSSEAGLKYFVFGSVTSTIMLYGLSLLFGLTGQTNYSLIGQQLFRTVNGNLLPHLAVLLVALGFLFKISAVPFHFWAPDVYEGAPTPVSGFVSTASKAAGFAILVRFITYVYPYAYEFAWPLAILTMFVGNLFAVLQTNIKRMLAFSSVAQAGYMLMGVAAFGLGVLRGNATLATDSMASVIFYVATYMLTNIAAFAVVGVVAQRIGAEKISDFAGLSKRAPLLAMAMVAALLSLTGAPPLVGFIAKLFLFRSVINGMASEPALMSLLISGLINVLISVFYYLGVARAMYAEKSSDDTPIRVPANTGFVIAVAVFGILFTAIVSTPFWNLAAAAAKSFLQ